MKKNVRLSSYAKSAIWGYIFLHTVIFAVIVYCGALAINKTLDKRVYAGLYPINLYTQAADRNYAYGDREYEQGYDAEDKRTVSYDVEVKSDDAQSISTVKLILLKGEPVLKWRTGADTKEVGEETHADPDGVPNSGDEYTVPPYVDIYRWHQHGLRKEFGDHVHSWSMDEAHDDAHRDKMFFQVEGEKQFLAFEIVFGILVAFLLKVNPFFHLFRDIREVVRENRTNFEVDQTLQETTLQRNPFDPAWEAPEGEAIPGTWRPIRFEPVFQGRSLHVYEYGDNRQVSMDPQNYGFVLWAENEDGEVIEVRGQHPRTVHDFSVNTMDAWLRSSSALDPATHTGKTLKEFRLTPELPLDRPVVNSIVGDEKLPLQDRAPIKIYGAKVNNGLVVATGLGREGAREVIIPTGFLRELRSNLKLLAKVEVAEPNVLTLAETMTARSKLAA